MADSPLNYEQMIEDAMRGVAREALREVARHGLPGDHHFYITFKTGAPEVEMPAALRAQYPEEITIVLQHQYWNLLVDEAGFSVDLAFGGKRQSLYVPFAALVSFVDPSVDFGLQFVKSEAAGTAPAEAGAKPQAARPGAEDGGPSAKEAETGASEAGGDKVVSLDKFRKK
ncbi:MAG: ClpXP protease specificity-enhancing factor SspB [Alphaproteobacteria bacterium]|nr:ClpXP protease specificity-enhancing factor SspB [Alphaproteobacteria bacterium]